MSPRALVIAYDFPPHGAIGTMRTLRLVRELARDGWDVTVITSSPDTYRAGTPVETGLEAQIPAGVRVIRARAFRGVDALTRLVARSGGYRPTAQGLPANAGVARARSKGGLLRRIKDLVDAVCTIPDNESGWIAPAVVSAIRHMRRTGRPDVIYSSAPPWSGQVVAWIVAAIARRPWIADFRDPWARAPWREWRPAFRQRAAAMFERRVILRADAVLFVTRANLMEFAGVYRQPVAERFHIVPNGCDPGEFERIESGPVRPEFVLLHAGTLYGGRNPLPVVQAVARAVDRGALDRARFRLRFLGPISIATDLPAECRRLGIEDVVEFVPRVTREESLREMMGASALLLVQVGTTVSVPGKAYEYLAAGRPILSLAEEGETAELVRASGIGRSVPPSASIETIASALLETVALASGPYAAPPRELYDGSIHAEATARFLRQYAQHGRGHVVPASHTPLTAAAASAALEETRR